MENASWDDLRILLAVHREGSLLAAGRRLGLSTSTVGRRLDALEASLGRPLVFRNQSGTELMPAALRLIQLAEGLEYGLETERRDQKTIAGTLRLSVPDGLAGPLVTSLSSFRSEYPGIDIELIGESRMTDVAAREADIAVRLVRSMSSVLVEKKLGSFRFSLFASADYVRRYLPTGRLDKKEAARHAFIGLEGRWKDLPHEQWMVALGASRFAFRSSSIEAILEATRQGIGIAALLNNDPRNGDLIRLESAIEGPSQAFYLVYHRHLRATPHVRAAIAVIERHFRALS